MAVITRLEVQKRNKERVNVYLDDEYAFSLSMMDAATLRKGQDLSDSEIGALQTEDAVKQAVDRAARFLAYRPRSHQEVRQNLSGKGIDDTIIDTAMTRLDQLGYVDDRAFARFWVDNRTTFKPLGARALRYELRQKGISDAIVDEVLDSVDTTQAAYDAAQSRLKRLRGSDRATFRSKLGAFLQRRGFAYPVIQDVFDRLEDELDEDFFAEDNPDA